MKTHLSPRTTPAASALLALILLASTHAQTTAPDEAVQLPAFTVSDEGNNTYRAAEAVSAIRVKAALIDTPNSISVVTRDMIDDLGPSRILDVTRYMAGVQEGRGVQFSDRQIIRGFENNGRTVDNFLQGGQGGSAADNIDESIIDRIEIAKGPNAILSPAGSPGGSINVITKSPLYKRQRTLSTLLGFFDAQKVTLDLTDRFSEGSAFAYRLVGAFQDSRRYWDEDARLKSRVFAPMVTYKVSERTQLTVKLIGAERWTFREPNFILDPSVTAGTKDPFLAPGFKAKSLNGINDWSHVETHTADLFVLLTSNLNEHVSMRVAANGRYYFEDSMQEFVATPSLNNRYNPSTGELTQDYVWARNATTGDFESTFSPFFNPNAIPTRGDKQFTRHKTGTLQTDSVANYTFNGITSQTVAGLSIARQTNAGRGYNGTLAPINLANPDAERPVTWSDTMAYYNVSDFTAWQAYVNERLGFWKDRIQVSGGILHYDTHTASRNALTTTPESLLDDAKNMHMASILVKPLKNVSLYFSKSTNSAPTIANNLPLWRDGKQNEVGVKTEFLDQRMAFNAAYFEISQTNVTVPNPDRQTDPTAPEQLISNLSNHGLEFEVSGAINRNLSLLATYTHLKMRDSLGRRVRAVADHNASFLANYKFLEGGLKGVSLSLGVTYNGERPGDVPGINFTPLNVVTKQSFFIAPYYVTTAGITYSWRNYKFRLNVDNFLDDRDYLQQAGGRVSGTGLSTATGLNVKLYTSVSF